MLPATPRRPLGIRSESERRASTCGSHRLLSLKSPASSYGDSLGSPAVPATPAGALNTHMTPKRWTVSKLPPVTKPPSLQIPSELQKYVDATSTPYKKNTIEAICTALYNASTNKSSESSNQKHKLVANAHSCDDPFIADATPTKKNNSEHIMPSTKIEHSNANTNNDNVRFHRSSETSYIVTDENAQALLPPEACIFVANLPRNMADTVVHKEVKQAFQKYGLCWVKVRRNNHNNCPHAFVQYQTVGEARSALAGGPTEFIGGRSCRTEMVVAPRTLLVYRKDTQMFPKSAAHDLLIRFGAIAETIELTVPQQVFFHLPPGCIVKMAFYQSALNAVVAFRAHDVWSVEHNHNVDSRILMSMPAPSPCAALTGNQTGYSEFRCRGLYVGNLPSEVSIEKIKAMFGVYGHINYLQTRHLHPSMRYEGVEYHGTTNRSFQAYIYYLQPGSVYRAVHAQNGVLPHRRHILIQPRQGIPFINPVDGHVLVRTEPNAFDEI